MIKVLHSLVVHIQVTQMVDFKNVDVLHLMIGTVYDTYIIKQAYLQIYWWNTKQEVSSEFEEAWWNSCSC